MKNLELAHLYISEFSKRVARPTRFVFSRLDSTMFHFVQQVEVLHGADWIKVMATGGMRTPGTNVEVGLTCSFGSRTSWVLLWHVLTIRCRYVLVCSSFGTRLGVTKIYDNHIGFEVIEPKSDSFSNAGGSFHLWFPGRGCLAAQLPYPYSLFGANQISIQTHKTPFTWPNILPMKELSHVTIEPQLRWQSVAGGWESRRK